MKKLLVICSLIVLLCGCQSKEDKAFACIMKAAGETPESAKNNGITYESIKVTPAYNNEPINDAKCVDLLGQIYYLRYTPEGRDEWWRNEFKIWEQLSSEMKRVKSNDGSQIGWVVDIVLHHKIESGDVVNSPARFVLDKDFKDVLVFEPMAPEDHQILLTILRQTEEIYH